MKFDFDDTDGYGTPQENLIDVPDDTVVFSTYDDEYGIIPGPRPASEVVPDWYDDEAVDAPIADAINEGWVTRQPCRVEFNTEMKEDGTKDVHWAHKFSRTAISTHSPPQLGEFNIPIDIIKFHCYWTCHVPDGYSMLLIPPVNRINTMFTQFAGCIDFDVFPTITHCPTLLETTENIVVEPGVPLFQMIPFKRDDLLETATARAATDDEIGELEDSDYTRADREPNEITVESPPN